jgi:hypothetical protein
LRTAAVLENAESKASALSQAFSGCKVNWKNVVGYEKGNCWLVTKITAERRRANELNTSFTVEMV